MSFGRINFSTTFTRFYISFSLLSFHPSTSLRIFPSRSIFSFSLLYTQFFPLSIFLSASLLFCIFFFFSFFGGSLSFYPLFSLGQPEPRVVPLPTEAGVTKFSFPIARSYVCHVHNRFIFLPFSSLFRKKFFSPKKKKSRIPEKVSNFSQTREEEKKNEKKIVQRMRIYIQS